MGSEMCIRDRRKHADWRYGPPVPPKTKIRTPGLGKRKLNGSWRGGFPGGIRQCCASSCVASGCPSASDVFSCVG